MTAFTFFFCMDNFNPGSLLWIYEYNLPIVENNFHFVDFFIFCYHNYIDIILLAFRASLKKLKPMKCVLVFVLEAMML